MVATQLAQEVLLDQRNSDLGFDVAEVVSRWFSPPGFPGRTCCTNKVLGVELAAVSPGQKSRGCVPAELAQVTLSRNRLLPSQRRWMYWMYWAAFALSFCFTPPFDTAAGWDCQAWEGRGSGSLGEVGNTLNC